MMKMSSSSRALVTRCRHHVEWDGRTTCEVCISTLTVAICISCHFILLYEVSKARDAGSDIAGVKEAACNVGGEVKLAVGVGVG